MDLRSSSTDTGRRYALVLDDDDGGIAAAAVVTMAAHDARLELLAVEPGYRERGVEERMLGVAEALCDAFGCDRLVVPHAA